MRSFSEREPASIHAPTVAVCAPGVASVATVRPLGRVDTCVTGWRAANVASVRDADGRRIPALSVLDTKRRADITANAQEAVTNDLYGEKNSCCGAR